MLFTATLLLFLAVPTRRRTRVAVRAACLLWLHARSEGDVVAVPVEAGGGFTPWPARLQCPVVTDNETLAADWERVGPTPGARPLWWFQEDLSEEEEVLVSLPFFSAWLRLLGRRESVAGILIGGLLLSFIE